MADSKKGLQDMKDVPYIVFETELARLERIIRRMFVLAVVSIVLLVGTNAYWLYYESQFEEVETTVTQDLNSEDGDAIINDGVHINGDESEANGQD